MRLRIWLPSAEATVSQTHAFPNYSLPLLQGIECTHANMALSHYDALENVIGTA
jgi:hypothetical protein